MTNSEIQNILIKLQRATCCGKLKVVDELPEGNSGNGFVVFEDELYYWDGDEWIVVGGGVLPTFKTINGETIDDGPGDIVVGGTGLETLDEGNGFGWRLVGRNAANYGDIGLRATDLSNSLYASSTLGATGQGSKAWGRNTTASSFYSTAFGNNTSATASAATSWGYNSVASGLFSTAWGKGSSSGSYSTSWGFNTISSNQNSTAWGNTTQATQPNATAWGNNTLASKLSATAFGGGTTASNYYATSWGKNTVASSDRATAFGFASVASGPSSTAFGSGAAASGYASTAFGIGSVANSFSVTVIGHHATVATGQNTSTAVSTDELFKIGNGVNTSNRSDALLILKNGTITAPSLTNALITTAGNKALITKEYLDANAGSSSGLEAIDEGNGIGWRLIGRSTSLYPNIGLNAIDISFVDYPGYSYGVSGEQAFGWGKNNIVNALRATAWGYRNAATYTHATAWGYSTIASGQSSTSWGNNSIASAHASTSFGNGTSSTGEMSVSWGDGTTASGQSSTAFGFQTVASGLRSTVWGILNTSSGYNSTSWGLNNTSTDINSTVWGLNNNSLARQTTSFGSGNTANSYNSTVFGLFATIATGQSVYNIISTDELFKIGNGVNTSNRSDAFKIYKNAVQVQGGITAAAASALTPEPGMQAYVTTTDATFVTTGFWKYQGGAWTPF